MDVHIRYWSDDDLPLLQRLLGDPAMMEHLGGPETADKIRDRHRRYLDGVQSGTIHMFVITVGQERTPAGSCGFWDREGRDRAVWEAGWSVLPEFQRQGIATLGMAAAIELARDDGGSQSMHAFPSVENGASNAICRKLGFSLIEELEFEYPPGNVIRCNDWQLDLLEIASGTR